MCDVVKEPLNQLLSERETVEKGNKSRYRETNGKRENGKRRRNRERSGRSKRETDRETDRKQGETEIQIEGET